VRQKESGRIINTVERNQVPLDKKLKLPVEYYRVKNDNVSCMRPTLMILVKLIYFSLAITLERSLGYRLL